MKILEYTDSIYNSKAAILHIVIKKVMNICALPHVFNIVFFLSIIHL